MQLCLKVTLFLVVCLGNTEDATSSESDLEGESLGGTNSQVEVSENDNDGDNCFKNPGLPRITLWCPNDSSFNEYLKKNETGSFEVEIEHVGSVFDLKKDYGQFNLVSLEISEANLIGLLIWSKLEVDQFPYALEKLDISGNRNFDIHSLVSLGGMLRSLKHLSMRGTAVNKLDGQLQKLLRNYPNLEYLDVSYTGIIYLQNPHLFTPSLLTHLDVSGNDKLSFVKFHIDIIQQLEHLNISNCILRTIEVEGHYSNYNKKGLGNMKELDVSNNSLKEIPPLLLDALGNDSFVLDISRNGFGKASENCQTFHLWDFLQSHPTNGKEGSRAHIVGREELDFNMKIALSKCPESSCPPGCGCNPETKIVDCRNLGLKALPQVAPSWAEVLLLQNNNLTNLDGIQSPVWCNLRTLNVGYNNLSQIFPDDTIQGHCMCLNPTPYNATHSDCFPQYMEEIFLNNNVLQNSTNNGCSLLSLVHDLDLSANQIKTFAPVCGGSMQLKNLNLAGNEIVEMDVPQDSLYPNLKTLFAPECPTSLSQENLTPNGLMIYVLDNDCTTNNCIISDMHKMLVNCNCQIPHTSLKTCPTTLPETSTSPSTTTESTNSSEALGSPSEAKESANVDLVYNSSGIPQGNFSETSTSPSTTTKSTNLTETKESANLSGFIIICTIISNCVITLLIIVCCKLFWRIVFQCIRKKFSQPRTIGKRKKYDCFVVCSSQDFTQVREMIIVPLTQRGYSIAWHDNAFVPGDWIMHNIERAVQNSSRMMVFGTKNLISSRWGLHEIRRGCHEEFVNKDFKILAVVDETLPKSLNRDLYEIVCLRKHVRLTDSDYIQRICRFLPPQEILENSDLQPESLQSSLNSINELLERYEEIRRKERLTSARRMAELFHTYREKDKVSIRVDIATAFSSHVCDDKYTCTSCQKERFALIQRFKGNSYSSSALNLLETSNRQEYTINGESCEDITDILNEDGFCRGWQRSTC